jgi:flagellar basal-body rod protein FlgC
MDVIANNIANAQTTRTPQGGPYRREMVVFTPMATSSPFDLSLQQAGWPVASGIPTSLNGFGGVQVASVVADPSPFPLRYDPGSPDAVNGYVQESNVNVTTELVDMATATQAYQANVTAFDAAKQMYMAALNLGK